MSTMATPAAVSTTPRLAVTGMPTRPDLVDAGFVMLLGLLALAGFAPSFDSLRFLAVGAAGLLLGVIIAHVANVLRSPWFVLVLLTIVAFFLFGGVLTLTRETLFGIPTPHSLKALLDVTVAGWKELLTTLPPVPGDGQLLVLPYLLGLLAGVLAFALARRVRRPFPPVMVMALLLATVISLGTLQPASSLLGLAVAIIGALWAAVRHRRLLQVVGTGTSRRSQGMLTAGLIAVAVAGGYTLGGHLPGVDTGRRQVLRTYVEPPFDVTQFPSPLVGFRKYTRDVKLLWDQRLFTVAGAKAGQRVRIAVLDDYSGTVWGASPPSTGDHSGFRRVGRTVGSVPQADGEHATVEITIAPAYAGLADASLWVPGVGYAEELTFAGPRAAELAEAVRYDTTTGQAVLSRRLQAGDVVRSVDVTLREVPKDFEPSGDLTLSADAVAFVAASAARLGEKRPQAWEQVQAVASALRARGAYSDGTKSGERHYLPGHSVSRIGAFLKSDQPVGNDEQYASAFALMATSLGVPSRVVLGGITAEDGSVSGSGVRAWVEVHGANGGWYTVPETTFMPDRTKTPEKLKQPPPKDQPADQVPPPTTLKPPGALDTTFDTDPNAVVKKTKKPTLPFIGELPSWVPLAAKIVGYPVGALVLVMALLAAARGLRRRRRATSGTADRRLGSGWRELVDHARDLGTEVSVGLTRREEAAVVGHRELADRADSAVFGAGTPSDEDVTAYWRDVKTARRELTKDASRRRRFTRLVSLRSLLTRDPRPVETSLRAAPAPRRLLPRIRRA